MSAVAKVEEMHRGLPDVYLSLRNLDVLPEIKDDLDEAKNKLLISAVAPKLDKDAHMLMIKILGALCLGLIFCVVFLLTGEKLGLVNPLNHPVESRQELPKGK